MYKQKISQSGPRFCKIINRTEWNRDTPQQSKVIYKVHFQPIFINRNKFQVMGLKYLSCVKGRIGMDKIKTN